MPRKLPRIEPKPKYDFVLNVSKGYDEIKRKKFIKFILETTQHFRAFRYELDVNVNVQEKSIVFEIRGLKAPNLLLSKPGPASFEYDLYDYISGTYELTIVRKKNSKNIFFISIEDEEILLKGEPSRNKFVKLNIVSH